MKTAPDGKPMYQPAGRAEWRSWLADHHDSMAGVWLVLVKKSTGAQALDYGASVEELLCFGWIDSKTNPLDADRYLIWCTPRRPGSVWSKPNKIRVARLEASGALTAAGIAIIETAKADGSWNFLSDIDDLVLPDDLHAALAADPIAARHFATFPDGAKKQALYWIKTAKRPETRRKRISAIVAAAAEGRQFR